MTIRASRVILLNLISENWLRAQVAAAAMEPTKPKLKAVTKSKIKPSKLSTKQTQSTLESKKSTIKSKKVKTKNAKFKPVVEASFRSNRKKDLQKLGAGYLIRPGCDKSHLSEYIFV